ncbi:acyl-CoA synthetase [Rhodococcus oxybenzonivorans]|uniref:Acyl-CoA synthetase n=1 Tax=Rhodococcus oxybenzonivorans TaxID=1990687 RepID=A0A2S2C0D0_9NOCA|nr:AMP-binding protein [Rhodococcus oxybenzonivorans]AWK74341.1 acyl-CoA synthetase [Rhodococcus oxybenzonivorans]
MTADLGDQVLTPLNFLERAEAIHADRTAMTYHSRSWSYGEFAVTARRMAGTLAGHGVTPGDRVAVLASNTPLMLLAHFAVPLAGGVLVTLNHRLAAPELAYIVQHSGASLVLFDNEFHSAAHSFGIRTLAVGEVLEAGGPEYARSVDDERSLISLNYTSGTTGRPKGVMYHHRGAYLQALAMIHHARLGLDTVYLWTLPMFHCNGWCFPWAITAAAGTQVCLDRPDPDTVWRHLRSGGITHFNAAPTVLTNLTQHREAANGPVGRTVEVGTGGAPPSPTLLSELTALGIHTTHLYGLTETFGPAVVNEPRPEWNSLGHTDLSRAMAVQGNSNIVGTGIRVLDTVGKTDDAPVVDVTADGTILGEIAVRGNTVMLGYYHGDAATEAARMGEWFKTGDLGVMHPDGSVEIRDRAKDIVISGGENIATVEVEHVLTSHPAVAEAAVIGIADPKWGEVPVAVVTLRPGAEVSIEELIAFTRTQLAGFKTPKHVYFRELPKSGTGKILKHRLRELISPEAPQALSAIVE